MDKGTRHITIITPCYNESKTVISFLESVEGVLCSNAYSFTVVVVNDCSTDDTLSLLHDFRFKARNLSLHTISLENNVGHQAAIYNGFLFAKTLACEHFIVMDSDGEDAPAVIPALLEHLDADIVNVVRNKRREPLSFRVSYYCYKAIFRFVTGKRMNFGNFCLVSRNILEQAVRSNFSHFPAFLSRQKCITRYIVADREVRIGGKSKMGFKKLVDHALLSFAEYGYNMQLRVFKRTISR